MEKLIDYLNRLENNLYHLEMQIDIAKGWRKFRLQVKLFIYLIIPMIGVITIILGTYYMVLDKVMGY